MIKKTIVVLLLAALVAFGAMSLHPQRRTKQWLLDDQFSLYLTSMAENYRAEMNQDVVSYVDGFRVFKMKQDGWDMLDADALFENEVVLESSKEGSIKEFFAAVQEQTTVPPGCTFKYSADAYHVLAIDNTFFRMGYFLARDGECNGQQYAAIKSLGSSSIYYTKPLGPAIVHLGRSKE